MLFRKWLERTGSLFGQKWAGFFYLYHIQNQISGVKKQTKQTKKNPEVSTEENVGGRHCELWVGRDFLNKTANV